MPPENIRKYEDSIKKTVKVLSETTSGIESKIKELVLILNAVNQGLLTKEDQIKAAIDGVSKGKFESRAVLKQYLKQLDVADDALDKIIDQYVVLEQKTLDQVKRTEEYLKLERDLHINLDARLEKTEDISNLEEQENSIIEEKIDLVSDLVKKYQQFSSNISSNETTLKNLNIDLVSTSKGITQFLNESADIIPNLFNFDDSGLKKYSNQIEEIGKAIKLGKPTINLPGNTEPLEIDVAIKNLEELISSVKSQIDQEMEYRTSAFDTYIMHAMGLEETTAEQKKIQLQSLADRLENLNELSSDKLGILNSEIKSLSLQEQILLGQYVSSKKILDINSQDLKTSDEKIKQLQHATELSESFNRKVSQIGISLRSILDYMPLGLQRMLGVDELDQQISQSLTNSVKSFNASLAMGESRIAAMTNAAKAFGTSFASSLGPVALLAVAVGAVIMLVKSLEDSVSNISKEMGVSRKTASEINKNTKELVTSSTNKLATEQQILEIQKDYLENNGQILDLTQKNNQDLVQTAVLAEQAYGILKTDAMGVLSVFKSLGADDGLAQQLLSDIGYMADLAGMSPSVIAKDLIDSAKELSLYFGGMPKQAAKAAIQIRRMGMSLKQAGAIADKMLNIESFMTDMTELSAMTSGRMNFSEAFDLRMQGDLVGMTESIMKNIGTLQDFNGESEFVQRKLASTLGMEVTDLKKSLKLREMQLQIGEDNVKLLQNNLDKIGDIENMSAEDMKMQAEKLNSTQKLSVAFEKIKTTLMKALLPMVEAFSETLSSSSSIIDAIGIGFKLIGGVIKILTPLIQGFLMPFKWLADLIGSIVNKFEGFFGSSKKTDTALAGMNSQLGSTVSILEIIGKSIGAVFGGLYLGKLFKLHKIFGDTFSSISSTILDKMKGVGGSIISTVTGGIKTGAPKLSGLFDKINIFKPIQDSAKTILDKMKGVGGSIISTVTGGIKTGAPRLAGLFDKINIFKPIQDSAKSVDLTKPIIDNVNSKKGILGSLFDKINIFKKPKDTAATPSINPIDTTQSIGDAAKSIIPNEKGISESKSIFDKISAGMQKGIDIIKKAFGMLKDFLSGVLDTIVEILTKLGTAVGNFVEGILKGLGNGLSNFKPQALIGAAALTIISGALWVTSKAMENFNNVNWDSLAKAGASIAGLGLIAAGFGTPTMSGYILSGSVALAAMSGALWIFAKAAGGIGDVISKIQPIVESFLGGINKIVDTALSGVKDLLITLSGIDATQLLAIGPALLGISAGLLALSAGSIVEGLTSLFTSDPFAKLEKIALLADPMSVVSNSVKILADSLTQLGAILENLNLDKLGKITDSSIEVTKNLQGFPQTVNSNFTATSPQPVSNKIEPISNNIPDIQVTQPAQVFSQPPDQQTYIEKQSNINTLKMERLLTEIRDALQIYSQRPVMIGMETTKSLNNSIKGLNNR